MSVERDAAASPWGFAGESAGIGGSEQVVTLVDETSFCLSTRSGEIQPASAHGLFFLDTRFVSRLTLRVAGQPVEGLGVTCDLPFAATFLGRLPPPGNAGGAVMVIRRRVIGRGLVERIEVRNYGWEPFETLVELALEADFADLFAVKEGRVDAQPVRPAATDRSDTVVLEGATGDDGRGRSVLARAHPAPEIVEGRLRWRPTIASRQSWQICIEVTASVNGEPVAPRHGCDQPVETSVPMRRLAQWHETIPVVETDDADLALALRRTADDLGALRLWDPEHPDDVIVAAGAPWFMTVFGRDSLLTAWMALPLDPRIAVGVLRTLARLQGTAVDPVTEEEPGRILHEIRFHERPSWALSDGTVYYGSIDATPLFVALLGELFRWGCGDDLIDELLPHADRALRWIDEHGDRDGDGYVEYQRATAAGLENQGWKDSWDAIRFADSRLAEGPIALCEVQGYVYAAHLARADLADARGDESLAARHRDRAARLREAFNRDFWDDERGCLALALDGDKRRVDALASNMGHCLWSGILDEAHASRVAEQLMSDELFSGWGVRTLASSMAAFDPLSYHNGSVWPHDNALIAAGLMRYGHIEEAHRIIEGLLDASTHRDGRLPELFAGVGRDELSVPAPYPTSCIPQAWSAASPLLFVRTLLRLDPFLPRGTVRLAPALPPSIGRLTLSSVRLGEHRARVEVDRDGVAVSGLPPGVALVDEPLGP